LFAQNWVKYFSPLFFLKVTLNEALLYCHKNANLCDPP
jgi:hypothetical protein